MASTDLKHASQSEENGASLRATEEAWLAERLRHATLLAQEHVEVDPDLRGGVPVLRGTRFTVAQLLAELAEGRSLPEIARSFALDEEQMRRVLESFAICLDTSLTP